MSNQYPNARPWINNQDFFEDLAALNNGQLPAPPEPNNENIYSSTETAPTADETYEKEAIFRAEVADCVDVSSLRSLLEERADVALRQIIDIAEDSRDFIMEARVGLADRLLQAEEVELESLAKYLRELGTDVDPADYVLLFDALGDRLAAFIIDFIKTKHPQPQINAYMENISAPKDFIERIQTIADPYTLSRADGHAYTNDHKASPEILSDLTRSYIGDKAKELIEAQYPALEENSDEQ
jgi:hypothetical protein